MKKNKFSKIELILLVMLLVVKCVVNRERAFEDRSLRAQYVQHILNKQKIAEGKLKLMGGKDQFEGNVYIYHAGRWGAICDHPWDDYAARVVCRSLNRTGIATHSSQFGQPVNKFWLGNIVCQGDEPHIALCQFSHWGVSSCHPTHAAGVKCYAGTTPPKLRKKKVVQKLTETLGPSAKLRLVGGQVVNEGRVEIYFEGDWNSVCPDQWSFYEANVVCKHLKYGFASHVLDTDTFKLSSVKLSGIRCLGNETNIFNCLHEDYGFKGCLGPLGKVAAVICDNHLPDLRVDYDAIETSAHLVDVPLYQLRCAMEENCLAKSAYEIQKTQEDWQFATRRLLRFTAASHNIGNADFRPFLPKHLWQWHLCHLHYHSMEVFAIFNILDQYGRNVAVGHKASFCLEDNTCMSGDEKKYSCSNFGDQGISVNCSDIYHYSLDCQWVDVTDVKPGDYIFKMAVNPHPRIAEQSYHNNAALCLLTISETKAVISNCMLDRP